MDRKKYPKALDKKNIRVRIVVFTGFMNELL